MKNKVTLDFQRLTYDVETDFLTLIGTVQIGRNAMYDLSLELRAGYPWKVMVYTENGIICHVDGKTMSQNTFAKEDIVILDHVDTIYNLAVCHARFYLDQLTCQVKSAP